MSKTKIQTVELDTPIVRGETTIASVQVRKPGTGELRGLKLAEICSGDVDAMIVMLPRVTLPPLTEAEITDMDASDFYACANQLLSFLPQTGPSKGSPTA